MLEELGMADCAGVETPGAREDGHGDDDDRHPRAVGVHQVEHVLATLGEAGQPQEEAGH